MFLVDTCLIEEELSTLKASLQQMLTLVPEHTVVGLITFGTHVSVYELGFAECTRAVVFRGNKEPDHLKVSPYSFSNIFLGVWVYGDGGVS